MLRKKLFTLACVIAIVAIGACFLPPARVPPSPPLPPYLGHIRVFAIQVEDKSGEDLIDEDAMSRAVASSFNRLWNSVRAKPFPGPENNDATLRISINRKSASNNGKQLWNLALVTSSTLTTADGRLLWQEQNETSHAMVWLGNGLPPDQWNSPIILEKIAYSLALHIGERIR